MFTAAGVALIAPGYRALFVRRAQGTSLPGTWSFVGGGIEMGESPEDAMRREVAEETGFTLDTPATFVMGTPTPDGLGKFANFTAKVETAFEPDLGDGSENDGFVWASLSAPPLPMHPWAQVFLDRLNMNEAQIADAMAAGMLESPQQFRNMAFWAMRITGTGVAYRRDEDEFVFRNPAVYLNDDFLARVIGLPVVFEHPPGAEMDSDEHAKRNVGAIVRSYIVPETQEVWGIARVQDDAANMLMAKLDLSTSPGVVFTDPASLTEVELQNGKTILIEGDPALFDHIAICAAGVWDKGQPPSGIDNTNPIGTLNMSKENEEGRKDADAGEKLDKVLAAMDSIAKRMDAFEEGDKARKDAEDAEAKAKADAIVGEGGEAVADKARKDAEDADEKAKEEAAEAEAKADKARKDADEADRREIRDSIKRVEALIPKDRSDDDFAAMADAQARADDVHMLNGQAAPRPLSGETLQDYRVRLAGKLQAMCINDSLKSVNLRAIGDSASFSIVEDQIYADARASVVNPANIPSETLRAVVRKDSTGRQITEFYGKPRAWMDQFSGVSRRVTAVKTTA